jgi:hypothetical protein
VKRRLVLFAAVALLLSGNVAVAEVPVTAAVVNCELNVQASNGPVNTLVDLTVMKVGGLKFGDDMRFTQKIRTSASGSASATVKLRQLFPGRDLNGLWGVSVDIGVTTVTVSGCGIAALPNTSTSRPAQHLIWLVLIIVAIGVILGATIERRRRARASRMSALS